MSNPMLELAKKEGHRPRHKWARTSFDTTSNKTCSALRAKQFLAAWTGGPFTASDIRTAISPGQPASRDTARRVASHLTINELARVIGKKSASNTTIYELAKDPS